MQKLQEESKMQPTDEAKLDSEFVMFEDMYPQFDRRHKGWVVTDILQPHKGGKAVPRWRFIGWDIGKKYDGKKLRELREKNGHAKVRKA